jgi:hypothetical protein
MLRKPSVASMTLKGRFGFCVVCGNCGGAGRACGSGNGVRSNNVSIKIAATLLDQL